MLRPRPLPSRVVAAVLVAASLVLAPASTQDTAVHAAALLAPATSDPRFGVVEASAAPDLADQLGVRWTRLPFPWSALQPEGPTSWNPFYLGKNGNDAVVDDEVARGRSVVGILEGTPAWARERPDWGDASPPINLDQPWNSPTNYWAAYCYRMAHDYAGRITSWVIWNEVSIPPGQPWTQWRGTLEEYARLLQVAYLAIKAANPQAQVVMYGEPYWFDHGAYLARLYALLHQMDPSNQYGGYFDVANLHLYSGATTMYGIVGWLRQQLHAYGWDSKEVWVSETNVEPYDDPTAPQPPSAFRVSMSAQSSFLVEAFAELLAAQANRIEVYKLTDGGNSDLGMVNDAG